MERREFEHAGLKLSYLDAGGSGRLLVALHSHWMDGTTFRPLAKALAPGWRVIAPDQRGHGYSGHARSYTREDYLADLGALLDEIGAKEPVVLLGNSLGGVNAYQFAARNPQRVRALIIEDIGAAVHDDLSFVAKWAGVFPTKAALEAVIGARLAPYLESSFRESKEGWTLAFEPQDMLASQEQLNGDHWADWLGSSCPALLVRGKDSRVTRADMFAEMARRRPNTRLVELAGGHVVHAENLAGFRETVREFLAGV